MKNLLGVRKPGQLKRVGRVLTGPEVGGSRPVCVTFPSFPARDEIWKRAGCLAGSSIYISEDVTRRAKDSRTELRRFMREVKSVDPGAEYRCREISLIQPLALASSNLSAMKKSYERVCVSCVSL